MTADLDFCRCLVKEYRSGRCAIIAVSISLQQVRWQQSPRCPYQGEKKADCRSGKSAFGRLRSAYVTHKIRSASHAALDAWQA